MPPKFDSLADRMKMLLSSGNGADVHFLVGDGDKKEELSAHKSILISASDVFDAMFRYDAKNAKSGNGGETQYNWAFFRFIAPRGMNGSAPVEVIDVEPAVFKTMLDFIYTDDLSGLNGHNAMAVLFAAKKYLILGLISACVEFEISKLHNVFLAFAEAQFIGEEEFASRCLDYIDKNAEALIKSDQFLQIDQQLLSEILDRNQLKINGEVTIWNAVLHWADEQCRRNDKDCSAENRRAMLGPALFKIRLPLIPKEDFSAHIVPSGVLTQAELISIFMYHCRPADHVMPEHYPLQFSTQKRYKYHERIMLKIEKLSEFARKDGNSQLLSEPKYIKDFPWKILAIPRKLHRRETQAGAVQKCLGYFLQCNAADTDPNWSCAASANLRIISQKEGKEDHVRKISHVFCSKENDWGFAQFMTFEDLMDTESGWYDEENDTVTLAIELTADDVQPTGSACNSSTN